MIPIKQLSQSFQSETVQTIQVSALHAMAYCPRLYYLEEVEPRMRLYSLTGVST